MGRVQRALWAVPGRTWTGLHDTDRAPSWRALVGRLTFPSVYLVYTLQTVNGIHAYARGTVAVAGSVGIGLFAATYVMTLSAMFTDRFRPFWTGYAMLVALCGVELAIAHQYAFCLFVFVGVPLIAVRGGRAVPFTAGLVAIAAVLPAVAPSWRKGADYGASTAIILLAMDAFFAVINTNRALIDARAQIARLAAENERNRIARDLHDLLGHSLTAITVKAALARRLAATDPTRASAEIAQVEELTRHALAEVRAAVTGYHDVSLATELATGAEILRAGGIEPRFPTNLDSVDQSCSELFGWAVREAVTNVLRHAHATTCTVRVGPDWIDITDNGATRQSRVHGSGLRGLTERARATSGRLTAGPNDLGGWTTRIDIDRPTPATVNGRRS